MQIKKVVMTMVPLCLSAISLTSCNSSVSFKEKNTKVYLTKLDESFELDNIYYSDSKKGIPYIDLAKCDKLLNKINELNGDKGYKVDVETNGSVVKFTRENKTNLTFDLDKNTVTSNNYNLFKADSFAKNEFDIAGCDSHFYDEQGKVIEGQFKFYANDTSKSFVTKPEQTYYINLDAYNIDTYHQGNKYLIPFQTFYDIAGLTTVSCLYNGESFFISTSSLAQHGDAYLQEFYKNDLGTRSKELIEYNYNEFVRDLDYNYGLAKEHNISSFYNYFESTGLKDLFMSDKIGDVNKALAELQLTYIADGHTGFTSQSPYDKYDPLYLQKLVPEIPFNPRKWQTEVKSSVRKTYRGVYKNIYLDPTTGATGGVLMPIIKNDDTLIVTFDKFAMNQKGVDYYYTDEFKNQTMEQYLSANPTDSVAIIHYANEILQEDIKKQTPEIKNVIIDISGNGGGQAITAIYTLGWLGSALMPLEDPITGQRGVNTYGADVNFDKTIDEKDLLVSLDGKGEFKGKVYCVTSESSFSCGNYVPAMLKQSGLVKLIGTKSGGGACVVHVGSTADGSGICYSGSRKLCRIVNGSFYSIDEGVEPDYYLDDYEKLYGGEDTQIGQTGIYYSNRKNLIDYIKSKI